MTARQLHLHRGCYPFFYPEPRPTSGSAEGGWQTDVDNRIRFGFSECLKLGVVKPGDTVICIQGWTSGGNHTVRFKNLISEHNESSFNSYREQGSRTSSHKLGKSCRNQL